MTTRAVIFGCAGPDLTADERAFFRDADPLGFILFARNVDTPERTRRLVEDLRSSVARAEAPVLIDQEGGRVARLRPPHWRKAPPAAPAGRALCARSRARAGSDRAQFAPAGGRRRLGRRRRRLPAGARHRLSRDPCRDRRPRLCRPARAGGGAGPRRRRGAAGRRRHAGDQAHARPRPRHRRQPRRAAAGQRLARHAGAHRLPALQAAGRPALGDDRPPAVRGDRSRRPPSRFRHGA